MPKPTNRGIEENIFCSLTADGAIKPIEDFMPQLGGEMALRISRAFTGEPEPKDPFEWARCLTDEEIVALSAPKAYAFLKD